jgi:hypothetical protein
LSRGVGGIFSRSYGGTPVKNNLNSFPKLEIISKFNIMKFIGLGSNMGDKLQNLKAAIALLEELATIRALSSV